MNKKFIVLSDDNIAITNEEGHITKRVHDGNSQEVLLSENKLEIIDNKLKKLNEDLNNQEGVEFLSKWMLIFQPLILLFISTGWALFGGWLSPGDFITYAIYNGVKGLVYGTIITGATAIFFGITKAIYKKKANKTKSEITIAKKLKEEYEKELANIKERQQTIDIQPTINAPISLIEQTNDMVMQVDEEINRAYTENLNRGLVLRRTNDKKVKNRK